MNAILIKNNQQGLTLIELLIAMMLGAFLLGSVIQTFLAARQSYRTQEGLSRMIENGRYAIEFISRDIRMAGFRGCNSSLSIAGANNHLAAPTAFLNDFDRAIQGFESTSAAAWTPSIDASFATPDGGSDIITIRRADEAGYTITAHASSADDISLTSTSGLELASNVLIADCNNAEVFSITGKTANSISHGPVLTNNYPTGEVFLINTTSYYIKTSDGTPSLFRKIDNNPQPLIEGVEDMEIYYGEDTDMNVATGISTDYTANYYVPANAVVNMRRVVSVRIKLLVATPEDNVSSEAAPYSFDGTDFDAPDKRIRREFTSTIALRNRFN